jgi:energy-coupling factor transport system permease protein
LGYFPNGNALTLEAIVYGLLAGILVIAVMAWFGCFNESMDSDKILYLFGKLSPNLSLLICMSLRFIPEFSEKASQISSTAIALDGGRTGVLKNINSENLPEYMAVDNNYRQNTDKRKKVGMIGKIKRGIYVLSALISWALEHSVKKAKSMKNREYGKTVRTNYSCYKWLPTDVLMLLATIICFVACVLVSAGGYLKFWYYPVFYGELFTMQAIIAYIFLVILGILPVIFDREAAIINIKK